MYCDLKYWHRDIMYNHNNGDDDVDNDKNGDDDDEY